MTGGVGSAAGSTSVDPDLDDGPDDEIDNELEATVDGRTRRSQRTRLGIVDATIALVEQGDLRPTAPRIAQEAGVSVRSVFQHFDDLESLFAAVSNSVTVRVTQLVEAVDAGLPFDERLEIYLTQRARALEALTPIRRAAAIHAPFSAEITARVAAGYELLRADIRVTFAPELAAVPEAVRQQARDQLTIAMSWPTWESLRTSHGRSVEQASAVQARMIRTALGLAG